MLIIKLTLNDIIILTYEGHCILRPTRLYKVLVLFGNVFFSASNPASTIGALANGACFTSNGGIYHGNGDTYYELKDDRNGQVHSYIKRKIIYQTYHIYSEKNVMS